MESDNGPEQEKEEYFFLEEKIKNDTVDTKKIVYRIFKTVGRGLIFGIAVSVGFFAFKPLSETIFRRNPDKVTIPQDDEPVQDMNETETKEPVQQTLTIENQKQLTNVLQQVAEEADRSMVEVIGIHENPDWVMENPDENSVAGVIVADNGPELLILTDASVIKDTKGIQVEFVDHTKYDATLKKKDGNIDMAILSVAKSSIKDTTWAKIQVAQLGNSNALLRGEMLLALGEPFSYADGFGIGVASSVNHKVLLADGEYNILVTDMAGTEKSSGALFDVDGKVVGIIRPDFLAGEDRGVLTAFGISSIKSEIELMSNAKDVPYIGIRGTMVTETIAEENYIPEGLYVIEVETNSPAMAAGVQAGDIITSVGKENIQTLSGYHNSVMRSDVGNQLTLKGKRRGVADYVDIGYTVIVGKKE